MPKIRAFHCLIEYQSNIKWNKSWWITVISIGKKAIQDPSMSTLDMKCVPCCIKLHFIETAKVNFNSWVLRVFTFMLYGMDHNCGNKRVHRPIIGNLVGYHMLYVSSLGKNGTMNDFLYKEKQRAGWRKRSGGSLGEEWGCSWKVL